MEVSGVGKVLFCHATPKNPNDVLTRLSPEDRLVSIFAESDADVVVCGHTHMQFDRAIGRLRVVNAGSVGMPFGDPGAYPRLLLGPEVEFHRTEYDLEIAASRIRQTHYPEAEEFASQNVLFSSLGGEDAASVSVRPNHPYPANRWPFTAFLHVTEIPFIAVHARLRQRWLILFSLGRNLCHTMTNISGSC